MPSAPLSQYLPAEHISVPLRARSFKAALAEMVDKLIALGVVRDVGALQEELASAGSRDVVSIGRTVALPHFRTEAVDRMVVALGIARAPLETAESQLSIPPRVIALVIAPPEAATLYLQTVAALARFLQQDDVVDRLHNAGHAADVVQMPEFGALRIEPQLTVRDLMVHNSTTVLPDTKARDAVGIMISKRLRALPVLSDSDEVLGIITEWDVMRALLPHIPQVRREEDEDPSVRDVMTRSVLCVPEEMGLEEAVNLMINKKVEQCPVVRDSTFVGMLTRSEIIRKLFAR